jgi:hypothetical protein
MKKLFILLTTFCVMSVLEAQTTIINKQLKDFPNVYDLSTPLNAGITISYFFVNGTESLWRDASLFKEYFPKNKFPDRVVDEKRKERFLNYTIEEIIVYKDLVACMISKDNSNNYYIRWLGFADGKWLNLGEDMDNSIKDARKRFNTYAPNSFNRILQSEKVKTVSTDTLAFVNYVKQQGSEPKTFLLDALSKYLLVIYGEIHRRKVSWDFLSSVIFDPKFHENVGTVFVEMPVYQQSEFDRFYASEELNTEILLEIFRSMQVNGWYDKGEYEFLINIWKLNQTLPIEKKIRVVSTDEQAPWKLLQTSKDFKKYEKKQADRNTRMADVIEHTIKTKTDKRNCLFTVGYMHAYKSHVPGGFSSAKGQEPALSAGAQLVKRLSEKNVFIVFQHVPMGTNFGALGFIRQGLFDAVFEKMGNRPVGFQLAGSPFGAEPFDADYQMSFDKRTGNFADNFDGYIFLQPIKDEDSDYLLYEVISEKFIEEMKRRIPILGWGNLNRWFGIEGEITKEKILESLNADEGKKRWGDLFE